MYVDEDVTECCGETALCLQMKMLHIAMVRLLYALFIDEDFTECCGETALCMLMKMLHSAVMRLIYVCRRRGYRVLYVLR